jgi:hypothetical protein
MNCEDAGELITALVDNELSRQERLLIESHLKDCSRCKRAYEQERALKREIHNFGISMAEPAGLKEKILSDYGMLPDKREFFPSRKNILSFRTLGKPAFAAAVLVLVLLPTIYFLKPHSQPISVAALQSQLKIARGELSFKKTANLNELRAWQIRAVNGKFAPMEYNLVGMRVQPVGGLVEDIDGRQLLVTVYSGAGPSVTCFTFLGTEADAPDDATVFFDQTRDVRFYSFSRNGYNAVLHREGNVICLLVSDMTAQDLLQLARGKPMAL